MSHGKVLPKMKIEHLLLLTLVFCTWLGCEVSEGNEIANECYQSSCCHISPTKLFPPKVRDRTCYSGSGHDYRGTVDVTKQGQTCLNWNATAVSSLSQREKQRYGIGDHNFCRNPEPAENKGPWCYVSSFSYGYCDVIPCSNYPDVLYRNVVPSPYCLNASDTFQRPDVLFAFRGCIYYLTMTQENASVRNYLLYKFEDDTLTSFASPPKQALKDALNVCLRHHDIITFVTSDSDDYLYFYLQSSNIMLRADFLRRGWQIVSPDVYRQCTDPIRMAARRSNEEIMIRNVFDLRQPHRVFLEVNGARYECVWKNKTLIFQRRSKSKFHECGSSAAYFITRNNDSLVTPLDRDVGSNRLSSGEDPKINSSENPDLLQIVKNKPALAAPLLGFQILNRDSLVKLYPFQSDNANDSCLEGDRTSRIFKVFQGSQILQIIEWGKREMINASVRVQVNSLYIKRADFCDTTNLTKKPSNVSCCDEILKQFRRIQRLNRLSSGSKKIREVWSQCSLNLTKNDSCPTVRCFQKKNLTQLALCEIRMRPDPAADDEPSLDAILGVKTGERIAYADAHDASIKVGEIADSLQYSKAGNKLQLEGLIGSIQALQPVNFTELSESGAKQLINDFVLVVDNIADESRAKDWISIKTNERDEVPPGTANLKPAPPKTDPHSLLIITENTLQQMVSSGRSFWNESNKTISVTTNNVISKIERQQLRQSNNSINLESAGNSYNLSVQPSVDNLNDSVVVITSEFPNILQLIIKVNEGNKSSNTEGDNELEHENDENKRLYAPHSPVLSATVIRAQRKVASAIQFNIPYKENDIPDPTLTSRKYYFSCNFLTNNNSWNSKGCKVSYLDTVTHVVTCTCNHTTNFAILLQVVPPKLSPTDSAVLTLLSYIGESLTVFCLIITLVIFTSFRRSLKSERMVAHFHLVLALVGFHIMQLFASVAENSKNETSTPCIMVASLTHFLLLGVFMWMLCEGITLHLSVINVFQDTKTFKIGRYFLGWGLPLFLSVGTLSYGLSLRPYPTCYVQGVGQQSCLGQVENRGAQYQDAQPKQQIIERCCISTESYLIWALVIPAGLVLVLNLIVLLRVSYVIAQSSKAIHRNHKPLSERKQRDHKHSRKAAKGALLLMPILGLPWAFGFIPQSLTHSSLLYVFTVLNSTQGIFILLFYCIMNNEVKCVVANYLRRKSLIQQQSWTRGSNHRQQSLDLKRLSKEENGTEQNLLAGVQRSVSMNTTSTRLSGSPAEPESSCGDPLEQITYFSASNSKFVKSSEHFQ
ncbi:unnamed protein product [Clavelina lepadiformis]|uniref:Uncharacterized protein n=1 Tax=Clavelina lepadiformis TaxID=159417 RepID=A0ABP0F434_CLALP